ncbi:MAG: hypothetical protein MJB14_16105 [Spirochaetes bacterium]|nr:hypothetical protein [Spirochaetota bacterium]
MPSKAKKPKSIIRRIMLFLFSFTALIILLFVLIVYQIPFVFKSVFDRNLTYQSVQLNWLKGQITFQELQLSDPNQQILFQADLLDIDLNIRKTLLLNPTIGSVKIVKPQTFIIKEKNQVLFPNYLKLPFSLSRPTNQYPKIPFNVEHIDISQGSIQLQENKRKKTF